MSIQPNWLIILTLVTGTATTAVSQRVPCVGGTADGYPCQNVDLLAHLPLAEIGGGNGNDCWGWTDPETGIDYALMGRSTGTSLIELADPTNPTYLGNLPTQSSASPWRDIAVYGTYAFVVSEAANHGMQVFDLTELRSVSNPPTVFIATRHYSGIGSAHNIFINVDTGYAYIVGSSLCSGGLHVVNVQDPLNPTFAGCVSQDGYTHDVQVVVYQGPDPDHQGSEIAICSNEDTITIFDVTNKSAPVQLSRTGYPGSGYVHHAALNEAQTHLVQSDELDEVNNGHDTRTYMWDATDLDNPFQLGYFESTTPAVDSDLHVREDFTYQSNWRAGFRLLHVSDIASGVLVEEGFFDTYPTDDAANFNGAWGNYPYFDAGYVLVSTLEDGLFILEPTSIVGVEAADIPPAALLETNRPNPFNPNTTIHYRLAESGSIRIAVYDAVGRLVHVLAQGHRGVGPHSATWDGLNDAGQQVGAGVYFYQLEVGGTRETRSMVLTR